MTTAAAAATLSAVWTVYDRATQLHTVGSWIQYLLPRQDEHIRALLQNLGRRIEVIAAPLNVCLVLAHTRGSCTTQVFHARAVLQRVEAYVEEFYRSQKEPDRQGGTPLQQDVVVRALEDLLRDMDFALQALNLALLIPQSLPGGRGGAGKDGDEEEEEEDEKKTRRTRHHKGFFSPAALLRASARVQEAHDTGGDLTVTAGALYARDRGAEWCELSSAATIKLHRNRDRRQYELHVHSAEASVRKYPLDAPLAFELADTRRVGLVAGHEEGDTVSFCFSWTERLANQVQATYALVHDELRADGDALKPLDVWHVERLCEYENLREDGRSSKEGSLPAHLSATDEEIHVMFG